MIKTYDIRFASLTTKQLLLRPLNETDQSAIFLLRSDAQVNLYLDRPLSLTSEEALLFIKKIKDCILKNKCMYWAICLMESESLIGTICLFNFSEQYKNAEIGFELLPSYQGKGLMQEALAAILTLSFEKLNIQTLYAITHQKNQSCIHLLERFHFKKMTTGSETGAPLTENLITYHLGK